MKVERSVNGLVAGDRQRGGTDAKKGLGGWLWLLGLSLLAAPIRLLAELLAGLAEVTADGTWVLLTTPGSPIYHAAWGPLIVGEFVVSIAILVASLVLIVLFFSRHYLFPRAYIAITFFSIAIVFADAWAVSALFPGEPLFDAATSARLTRSIVMTIVWSLYLTGSARARATFVEKAPKADEPFIGHRSGAWTRPSRLPDRPLAENTDRGGYNVY